MSTSNVTTQLIWNRYRGNPVILCDSVTRYLILLLGAKLEALSQQLDKKIRNFADRDAMKSEPDTCSCRCDDLRNSKLSASNSITQSIQDSKLSTDRDAMRFGSDTCSCWCDDSAKLEALSKQRHNTVDSRFDTAKIVMLWNFNPTLDEGRSCWCDDSVKLEALRQQRDNVVDPIADTVQSLWC